MRTTLDIPVELLEEAQRILGFKSKTDTVIVSLKDLIRRKRVDELKEFVGKLNLEIDLPASRRKPKSSKGSR